MAISKIPDEDGKGYTIAIDQEEVEHVDPLTYFREQDVRKNMVMYREMLLLKTPFLKPFLKDEYLRKEALKSWDERMIQLNNAHIPPNFISLLNSTSKKEQESLLRNQTITVFGLAAYLIKAGSEFGYTMSKYRTEHLAKNVDPTKLPKLIHLQDDGTVKKVGYSPLTDGQLKNVILQRKALVAHFLDKGGEWHCFFQTEKSMRGEEKWRGGQPHLHYLSDKWGVSRADTVQRIKDGDYPATSVHIALTDYGPQPTPKN